jgi:hypothetical protein
MPTHDAWPLTVKVVKIAQSSPEGIPLFRGSEVQPGQPKGRQRFHGLRGPLQEIVEIRWWVRRLFVTLSDFTEPALMEAKQLG